MVTFFHEIKWKYALIAHFIKSYTKVWNDEKTFYNGENVYLNKLLHQLNTWSERK